MCGVWQRYNALATDGDTGSASSARVFTILISALKCLVTSRPAVLGVSVHMCGVGVPTGDKRTVLATRGDGGDGSQRDGVERCWDDWHR